MTIRILHIDDDPAMLEIVASVLSREPTLETRGCLSGAEGVRTAADWLPDLILSDVSMHGLSGIEVLDRLGEIGSTASIPVVLTTACGRLEQVVDYMAYGAAGVIVKPFNLRELANSVLNYLDLAAAGPIGAPPPSDIGIAERLRGDASILRDLMPEFAAGAQPEALRHVVHKLAGVAGIFGFSSISEAAATTEHELENLASGTATRSNVLARLDRLLGLLDRENEPRRDRRTEDIGD
ncbi:response regulator [Rhodopseudomonas palustris]|uniref:response regulator n=1 Tax=Rhodopseudomonas palustris TaxID=1076 RepID=UPI002ACE4A94|nr:response regulator [Rhodopseudomonas palustris]WQG97654.1 response regulator [Rhodopseudomonas palustris]